MFWAALIIATFVCVLCVVATVYFALRALQTSVESSHEFVLAHTQTLKTLESIHDKNVSQTKDVLDRFMALDFSLFKAYQSADNAEVGGFEDPTDDDTETGDARVYLSQDRFVRQGADIEERLRAAAEERSMIAEDFGEDFEKKEGFKA